MHVQFVTAGDRGLMIGSFDGGLGGAGSPAQAFSSFSCLEHATTQVIG